SKSAPRWGLVFDGKKEVDLTDVQAYLLGQKYLKEKGEKDKTNCRIRLHLPKGSPLQPVLPFARLMPDTYHRFNDLSVDMATHVLYMHYPHGGIHGLKMFGTEK